MEVRSLPTTEVRGLARSHFVTKDMICGGTGFNITSRLPPEIECCDLDYSIFPDCDTSYIWFSRGCFRNCKFCIVCKKEGMIHTVSPKNRNPNGKTITVMDNNFFANPDWRKAINILHLWGQPCDFQGVDARILDDEMIQALKDTKMSKRIKMAWDNAYNDMIPTFKRICEKIRPDKIMVYVLIGFDTTKEQDLYRVEELRKLGVNPFVMPYDKKDKYQKKFARYVNNKIIFKSCTWEDFSKGKKK